MSYHSIELIGRLTRDPDVRNTPGGKQVASFTVAVDVGWGDRKKTAWWKVTCWEGKGSVAERFLTKGRQVHVRGKIQVDETGNPRVFQKRDGSWGAQLEVVARELTLIGGRGDSGSGYAQEPPPYEEEEPIPF